MKKLKEEIIERLKADQDSGDPESAHSNADDALCDLLINLGYSDVVAEYNKVEKWYA
ncbi:hypothetical protein [Yersinia aleksiciae]|uniref:hypothetical protein n=1 Tax=Yersinia aleksiciae TaxID=263819 RepID=UPI001427ABEB|nr:hypothetical protein [Yersinia aleksiciae]MDA5496923.1 hypothetical protein [Yersinia aleksiciae]NIK98695.1 hypothetical protein [Yersinia aleksiciae]WQC72389.1 hypothetical protein N0K21_08255 [Yersinia aleksiciae]